jgi:predicted metal-dependent peptidase
MIDINEQSLKLKKAHLRLMKHPETCLYGGVVLMGKSEVEDKPYTAYTDGKNKRYSAHFLTELALDEVTGLVLHENLHVLLKHLIRYKALMQEDRQLANAAMDYVVNDIIMSLKDKALCKLPKGGLYNPKFHNWSVREVWDYLKTGQHNKDKPSGQGQGQPQQGQGQPQQGQGQPQQGQGQGQPTPAQGKPERSGDKVTIGGEGYPIGGMDEHDENGLGDLDDEGIKKLSEGIDEAIRQGGMLAGRYGVKLPRVIEDMLASKVNWKAETQEFVTTSSKGNEEYTWRKFNRRRIVDDLYLPTSEDETLGEWVLAIDTSGSMTQQILTEVCSEVQAFAELCNPERLRILWWDTKVHGEQVFNGDYENLHKLLKPLGGGGTEVGCVSRYIKEQSIKADCLLVLTDGYLEDNPVWDISIPTLWMVTQNSHFTPPAGGRKVFIKEEM